ncbi:MAG: hypothetical protein ACYDEI_09055 [Erysipelotrichaceae bacterium]
MFKIFKLFGQREISEVIPEIVYYYLFLGDSLTNIELKLFNTTFYHGWLSKSCLNFYGIDTNGENRGIFKDRKVEDVVKQLLLSDLFEHKRIANILMNRFL